MKIIGERECVRSSLERERNGSAQTEKDVLELITRLNYVDMKAKEAQIIRQKFQDTLSEKQEEISNLVGQLAHNEGFIKICSNYLEDTGIITETSSSLPSDENNEDPMIKNGQPLITL